MAGPPCTSARAAASMRTKCASVRGPTVSRWSKTSNRRPKWRSSIRMPRRAPVPRPRRRRRNAPRDDRPMTSVLWLPDLGRSVDNLMLHKLRTLLTMLGMIFGVAAVVAMLSIGAGAQQEVMAFIEQLGVRNLIVEAREAPDSQALQKIRKLSPGLNFKDFRVIGANVEGIAAATARKRFTPSKLLPRP